MNMRVRGIGFFSLFISTNFLLYISNYFDGLDFLVLFSILLHILYKQSMAVLT